jgi:uncharacterized protein (DUF983 family)
MARRRTTETPLALPSLSRFFLLLSRGLRFRCPNCGEGTILKGWGDIRERCPSCNFRYARSDDNYFGGAVFSGTILVEALFAIVLTVTVLVTWPDVPWDELTYVAAIGVISLALVIQPIARVAWLTIDSMFRPIMPEECE